MKIFKTIIVILFSLWILGCFIAFWIEPRLNLWELGRSIVLSQQNLPLVKMFIPAHNHQLIVSDLQEQFILSGPNLTLFDGEYEYNLEIVPACQEKTLGYMDVVRKKGLKGLGAREIIAQKISEPQIEKIKLDAETGFDWEFRLYSYGNCSFEVKRGWLVRERVDWRGFLGQVKHSLKSILMN